MLNISKYCDNATKHIQVQWVAKSHMLS